MVIYCQIDLLWQCLGAPPEMGLPPRKDLYKTEQGQKRPTQGPVEWRENRCKSQRTGEAACQLCNISEELKHRDEMTYLKQYQASTEGRGVLRPRTSSSFQLIPGKEPGSRSGLDYAPVLIRMPDSITFNFHSSLTKHPITVSQRGTCFFRKKHLLQLCKNFPRSKIF